jgi:phospholipase/carboxylesterase
MTSSALLNCIEIESAPNPTAAVIWMHGLGASGDDFAGLYPELDLSGCPSIRFVFPHAPQIPVTVNGGYVMPAWYDIFGTELGAGAIKREDDAGIRISQAAIEALIAREVSRGIQSKHIVLAGFSQGCAMALHTGLRQKIKLAGIMALSGYLPLASLLEREASLDNQATPIFMAHGLSDPVVILSRAQASRDQLTALGYRVEWHEYPMPHSVHPREVADISAFLRRVLG